MINASITLNGASSPGLAMATNAMAMAAGVVQDMNMTMIDASNKIFVEVINPTGTGYYVGGDVVMGKIHLTCNVPFFCKGVIIQVKGEEKAVFQEIETYTEGEGEERRVHTRVKEYKSSKEFFNQKLVPYPQSGVIPQGVYEYPFQYPLPIDLPGVFSEKGGDFKNGTGYKGKIEYKLIGTVDVAVQNDLKHKVKIIVNEKFDKLVQPSFAKDEKKFLLGKGKLAVQIALDKNAYFPGDRVLGKLEANNTSTKKTRKIVCKVHRNVKLNADGHTKVVTTQVHRSEHSGFEPCFFGIKYLPFYIPVDLPPSTKGSRVESFYFFTICCDIPGAIDLEIPLNVRILAPQFLFSTIPETPPHVPPPPDVAFRPPWIEDSATKKCTKCGTGFSLLRRKHHCRHCGQIFCDKCTKNKTPIANLCYVESVRVCESCYPIAQTGGNLFQPRPVD